LSLPCSPSLVLRVVCLSSSQVGAYVKRVKVNFSPCSLKYHTVQACEGGGGCELLQACLVSVLSLDELSVSLFGRFIAAGKSHMSVR
jgi:hypothetical protein